MGVFFLFIALDYFTFALLSLGAGKVFDFLLALGLTALVLLSYVLLRKGERAQRIYNQSKYAKAPPYPFKLIAAVLLSCATAVSAYFGEYGLPGALMLGVSVFGGWYLYYGFDVLKDKLGGYGSDAAAQRIMTLIAQSQKKVDRIRSFAKKLRTQKIAKKMQEVADGFEKIIEHVAAEPEDYEMARRYLVSYIGEIESMSETFYKLDTHAKGAAIQESFYELLEESTEKLGRQYHKLLDDDMLDLDIKISVMKKRFQGEV